MKTSSRQNEVKKKAEGLYLNKGTDKSLLMLKAEDRVKTYLKPFFARGLVSKESYKIIMRKCVEKVYDKSKIGTIRDEKIALLVKEYVTRYKNQ